MTAARRLALIAVFASLAWTTLPGLITQVRDAHAMQGLTVEQRRLRMFGAFHESIRRIDATISKSEPLALVAIRREDIDAALFFAYYVFPRPVWLDVGLVAFRMREPRIPHAVLINTAVSPEARLMPYPEMRAEVMGATPVVKALEPGAESVTSLVVPLVTSGDGPPPDVYTTEAAMENRGSAPARVMVQMYPAGRSATVLLKPGQRRTWTDFVYQTFGVLDVGWLSIDSDHPIAAGFWLVNRGRKDADRLHPVRWFQAARLEVPVGGRMWVINPHARELPVRLNGGLHRLPPHALIPLEWVGLADVAADDDWYAFVSWRDDAGRNHLRFPGDE